MELGFTIVLLILGVASMAIGVYTLITKKYDEKRAKVFTRESLLLVTKVQGISNILTGVGIIITGLSYSSWLFPKDGPFYWIGWAFTLVVLLADSIIESKLLKKLPERKDIID